MIYFCSKKAAQKDESCFLLNYKLKESLRVNVSNFQLGPCNSEKTKNLKKFLKIALGELLLKIYILPRSDKCFGRTEINLVSQLSDQVLGV